MRFTFLLLLVTVFISGCKTYSEDDKQNFDKEIQAYLKKKNIKCEKSGSGLYYQILEEGEGDLIGYNDNVSFTYRGEFLDGKVFDQQNEPVEFKVRTLIQAWKETMIKLKPGGKAFIVVPPQLGYGDHKLDDIPANSILVYELEVLEVR